MLYDQDYVRRNGLEEALERVRCITAETLTYMKQMASAPRLVSKNAIFETGAGRLTSLPGNKKAPVRAAAVP